jgi:hypothetical protein
MAINNRIIDIDAKLSLTKKIKIAGKEYELTISDKIDQVLTELMSIDIPQQMEQLTNRAEKLDESEKTSAQQYKKFIRLEIEILRKKAIQALDKILGEGEGARIYQSYHTSTKALLTIIGLLQQELNDMMIERKQTADTYYKNRHKKK